MAWVLRVVDRLVLWLLRSDIGPLLGHAVGAVRYTARDGTVITLPVQLARRREIVAVLAGSAERKSWWRHFRQSAEAEVWIDDRWQSGIGLVEVGARSGAADAYRLAHPAAVLDQDATFVRIRLAKPDEPVPLLHGHRLARLWFWVVTVAEFAGFASPALVGAATADAGAAVQVPALLLAGLVEGGLLGLGQSAVLRLVLVGLSRRRWITVTGAAAAFAYGFGLLPALLADALAGPPLLLAALAAVAGVLVLGSIGTAQWLVLRRHVERAGRWIVATALAWTVGLSVFLASTTPLWQPGQPLIVTVAIGLAGGLMMAATTSAITGHALRRILG